MTQHEKSKPVRNRGWCLTINNYTDKDVEDLKTCKYTYIIIGNEVGESGTPHLQIYLYYKNARTFTSIKKLFKTAHIEPQSPKSTAEQNQAYCSKQSVLFEDGILPKSGKRTDIEECKNVVQNTHSIRQVVSIATSVQGIRIAEKWLEFNEVQRDFKPKVQWFYGDSGSGKTKLAYEIFKDFPDQTYTCMDTGKWFQGYDGHAKVIIDDMRGDFMKFHQLIKLIDRYPYKIECKGGSRQFLADHIIITSIFSPTELFKNQEDEPIKQLLRRIDEIKHFKKKKSIIDYTDGNL